jgi:outer membrane immunogenic protein
MKRLILGGAALAAIIAGPAVAADMKVKALYKAPPPAPFSWSGCYIGGNAGYGWDDTSANLVVPSDPGSLAFYGPTVSIGALPDVIFYKQSGFIAGGQIGCNRQVDRFVVGIEGDLDFAHISGSGGVTPDVPPTFTPGAFSASSTLKWMGTVRARFGFTPFDRWLVYVTGGLAYGASTHTYSLAFTNPPDNDSASSSVTDYRAGPVVGAGVEWAFYSNWSAKAEYLRYDLGTSTDLAVPGGRALALAAAGRVQPLSNYFRDAGSIVRFGLNYRLY